MRVAAAYRSSRISSRRSTTPTRAPRSQRSALPVLVVTGYPEVLAPAAEAFDPPLRILGKPIAYAELVVALGLMVWAVRSTIRAERIGLALVAGGALGNAQDRWRQGAVTDFIDLHWGGWHWPTFNGADIAISAGVGLMLLAALADYRRGRSGGGLAETKAAPAKSGERT